MILKEAVCALIFRGDKIIAVSRKDNLSAFGLIGGKVDEGENKITALYRETEEETGLKITKHVWLFSADDGHGYNTTTYLCEAAGEISTKEKGVIKEITWDELFKGPFGEYNQKVFKALTMDNLLKEKKSVGVIICRMQVPFLTESHFKIVHTVLQRHNRVIMFLGTTNEPIDSKDPYAFEFRKEMIEQQFDKKRISIVPLPDIKDNNPLWVSTLDNLIKAFLSFGEEAILYGGRDSFIPWYKKDNGMYDCVEFAPTDYDSGTELRFISSLPLPSYTQDSALAILWALRQVEK